VSIYDKAIELTGFSNRKIKDLVTRKILPQARGNHEEFIAAVKAYVAGNDIVSTFNTPRQDVKQEILSTKTISSYEQLMAMLEIDENMWEVKRGTINYWGKPNNGNIQLKATIDRKETFDEEFIQQVFDELKAPKKFKPSKQTKATGDYLLKINIFDLHYGKLCWAPETDENYDTNIASQRFLGAIHEFIEETKHKQIKEVLFPIGNDFFNQRSEITQWYLRFPLNNDDYLSNILN
jgi:hypothetical protein